MSKRLILVLALAFVVGFAAYAYAEVQNVKVGGDIKILGVGRNSFELNDTNETETAILSIIRARIDADLTDNVSATIRLLNERVWGEDTGSNSTAGQADTTEIDLDLAYVTLKEFLYSPLTLTLGRQELRFGNGLIIGDPDTNGLAAGNLPASLDDLSARKAFDAMRATLNYDPLVVDLVYSKIDENTTTAYNDIDLYGINAAYAVNKNLNTEVYLWQRSRDCGSITGVTLNKTENLRTAGARAVYTGIKDLTLGLESAFQFGDHVADTTLYPDDGLDTKINRKVTAYAIQAVANYAFPKVKYSPIIGVGYTRLSGDDDASTSDNYKGWSAMFEDQSGGTLFNKIMGYSNAQLFNVSGSLKPIEDVKLALDYYYIRLLEPYIGNAAAANLRGLATPTYVMKADKKDLAHELDLNLTYDYTEDVQFGLSTGWFIPGDAFNKANKKTATQVIGSMKVTF